MADTPEHPAPALPPVIRVAIIEDRRDLREGLAILISGTPGYRCTGGFRSMEEALPRIGHEPPHVALVDIGLPGISGIEGIRLLRERHPTLALLVLSVYDDDERIFEALCAGASGYLLKHTAPARLLECLREVVSGGAPMSPEVARRVLKIFREIRPPERADCHLTAHEKRLLKLLVEGQNFKAIAPQLGVTVHAISFHMRRIYEKLQVHSKSEAVAKALRDRLV
ncbi:MAG TPA: response regulator transcription factor [Blastocatellia bacterium]|nr:response regulator transcription factor [Blastocatellia bacterium]